MNYEQFETSLRDLLVSQNSESYNKQENQIKGDKMGVLVGWVYLKM